MNPIMPNIPAPILSAMRKRAQATRPVMQAALDTSAPAEPVASSTTAAPAAPVAQAPVAPATPSASAPAGFSLPELDPNDPDFDEKQKVHAAFEALEKHFTQNVPNVDFQKETTRLIEEQRTGGPKRREMNPLMKLGIALGTQNPEDPYAPNVGLAGVKETEDRRLGNEVSDFEKTISMKKEALAGQIRDHMDRGEFRKALKLAELKANLDIDADRRKSKRELEAIKARGENASKVANIRAAAIRDRVRRMSAAIGTYDLPASTVNQMRQELVNRADQLRDARTPYDEPMYDAGQIADLLNDKWDELWAAQETLEGRDIDKSGAIGDPAKAPRPGTVKGAVKPETGMVRVQDENGRSGSIPSANVDAWIKMQPGRKRL